MQTKASPWTVATASPGTEVVDQSQTGIDSGLPMQNSWQSFTAGISGRLTAVTIQTNGSSGTVAFTLNIYAGTGTGGTLLSSTPVSFNTSSPLNAERKMLIPTGGATVLTAGQVYTFQISGGPAWSGYGADANRYAGGVNSIGASFDAYFKTHITTGYVELNSSSIATPVGIGTSTPTTMLSVAGNANVTGNLAIGGTISAGTITANLSGNATNATNLNNQPASFYTNATNITAGTLAAARLPGSAARTDAANAFGNFTNSFAGPVAIGATSAAYNLDVVSGGDTQIGLTGNGPLGARTWTIQSSSSNNTPATGLNNSFQIIDRTAGIGRLLINPAGNIGIGTSTPTTMLSVA
ncbi:MAG: hypothetical protein NTV94_17865, partial [Planctomycetota bacterium]|nr:hypothetical protein [Planctomycetota bacterium]